MLSKSKSVRVSVNRGYSFNEASKIVTEYIDVSADRLRQRLVKAWDEQAKLKAAANV